MNYESTNYGCFRSLFSMAFSDGECVHRVINSERRAGRAEAAVSVGASHRAQGDSRPALANGLPGGNVAGVAREDDHMTTEELTAAIRGWDAYGFGHGLGTALADLTCGLWYLWLGLLFVLVVLWRRRRRT